ncbi:MAG: hypothetical protein J6Q14_01910, partial [Oscillospiraceae bacterium]|nr:hypothetical protein [Oscillospiraceae bacterium]
GIVAYTRTSAMEGSTVTVTDSLTLEKAAPVCWYWLCAEKPVVEENTLRSVSIFTVCYFATILLTTLLISLDNFSFATSFTAALTCISNVGPGLDMVGPSGNFSAFSPLSKLVLSACMVIGRLEIFPILVLFSRSAWRRA